MFNKKSIIFATTATLLFTAQPVLANTTVNTTNKSLGLSFKELIAFVQKDNKSKNKANVQLPVIKIDKKDTSDIAVTNASNGATDDTDKINQRIQLATEYFNTYNGVHIDVDFEYGGQCYDHANHYLQYLGSAGIGGGTGRAGWIGSEYKEQFESEGFTVIESPDLSEIQVGDVLSILPGAPITDPYYGHVSVVIAINDDGSFVTMEQNAEQGEIVAQYTRYYSPGDVTSIVRK